ncbi:MAG TPA: protein kinase [Kofleriaceae bacterium]
MGSRLGRYVVLKHLASGGMADVLLGRTDGIEGFERHVVLKRIRPEHAKDQRFIRMFLDEARVAANLHHQHIVQVHDIGEAAGELFIAMEYIHGEDVRTLLSNASKTRAHVPLGIAVAIVSAAAAGLHYAHERRVSDKKPLGIVHRDISPSNILVGYDGAVKVVDFGIAKASMRQETRSGSLKGKISYMAPEQCKGSDVDRRSDVYSLGVVLYELATTTRLFKGDNDYLVMDQIVNGRVSLPRVRRPDLPNELSSIIMKAIATDPERRYFTADELRVALDQFAARAGLSTASSQVGAFLRKQFGERPEPWLDLDGQGDFAFNADEDLPALDGPPSGSWTELPRSGDDSFRRSNSMISRPIVASASEVAPIDNELLTPPPSRATLPPTPTATDAKMGWESQPRPQAIARGMSPGKVAMIVAPMVAVLGFGVWKLAKSDNGAETVAAVSGPATTSAAASMPMVTPIPELPQVMAEATGVARPDKADPKARPAAAATSTSTSTSSPKHSSGTAKIDVSPPSAAPPRAEAPAPVAPAPVPQPSPATAANAPTLGPSPAPPPPVQAPVPTPAPIVVQPAAPAAPATVTPTALDANRLSGDKDIVPDDVTQAEIGRTGTSKVIGVFKLCLTTDGSVSSVNQLKSTGFPSYDQKITTTIRSRWRYRPYLVNGKASPVCTAVRFVYSQQK